jgi:hypothetical protein
MIKFRLFSFCLLSLVLLLAACSASPTTDPRLQYTVVAATVRAQLTLAAPAFSATPVPPTQTPTQQVVATITLPPTAVLATLSPATAVKTLPPVVTTADKAAWVSNTPADGSTLKPSTSFTASWTVTNTGATTWTTSYTLRFYNGTAMGGSNISFPNSVAPGASVVLSVPMTTPAEEGSYNSVWVLTNAAGMNFYSVTLPLIVGGSTLTPTVSPTPGTTTPTTAGGATSTATSAAATSTPVRSSTPVPPTATRTNAPAAGTTPTISDKPPI